MFFNDRATTEIYTLSLHDALPIYPRRENRQVQRGSAPPEYPARCRDRKSTRLNSSHLGISYAVFCLKKHTVECSNSGGACGWPRERVEFALAVFSGKFFFFK